MQSEDHKRIIPPRMMNYAKVPSRVLFIHSVDRTRDHYSFTEAGLVAERTERKEGVRIVHTRTEGRQTFPLRRQVYNVFRQHASEAEVIFRYKEIGEGQLSNSWRI